MIFCVSHGEVLVRDVYFLKPVHPDGLGMTLASLNRSGFHKHGYREVGDNVSLAVRTNPEAVLNVSSTAEAS